MRSFALATSALCLLVALNGATKGVSPRIDHTRYPVTVFNESLAVAAELMGPERVRQNFGPEVDSGYLVVEVGVYPREKNQIDIRQSDFRLRISRRSMLKPAAPQAMGEALHRMELAEKALPEVVTYKPVAGYLYFPVREKLAGSYAYELEYIGQGNWMMLPLPAAGVR